MGIDQKILVTGASLGARVASVWCVVALLAACGQKGNLFLPNDPEFQQRAKLPDIVRRQLPGNSALPAATPASSAVPTSTNPASAAGR